MVGRKRGIFSAHRGQLGTGRCAAAVLVPAALALSIGVSRADADALYTDVEYLADDDLGGRVTHTPGAQEAWWHLHDRLLEAGIAPHHITSQSFPGDSAVSDPAGPIPPGTSLFARVDGSDPLRRNQYVLIGAHYDHVALSSHLCTDPDTSDTDTICNGATDNAAGAAVVLEIARQLARGPRPRRSVVFAFWDREERDLMGSRYFRAHPLPSPWPQQLVTYVNYDIQGANLATSLRSTTYAVVARSMNDTLKNAINAAQADAGVTDADLTVRQLSESMGVYHSDYATFVAPELTHRSHCSCEQSAWSCAPCAPAAWLPRIPTIHFTDSSGPCYHTTQDEVGVVDFDKLDRQARLGAAVVRRLANLAVPPLIAPYDTAQNVEFGNDIKATIEYIRQVSPDLAQAIIAELGSDDPGPLPPPTREDAVQLLTVARATRCDPLLEGSIKAQLDEPIRLLSMIVDGTEGCYFPFPALFCPGELLRAPGPYRPKDDGVYAALAALQSMWVPRAAACEGCLTFVAPLTGQPPECP